MSISLVAVFIPILLMGGIVGRLFREFAVTLSVAIAVSLVVSLTTTPMMCAQLAAHRSTTAARLALPHERARLRLDSQRATSARFGWVLRHPQLLLIITLGTIALNVYLFVDGAEGLLPAAGHRPHDGRDSGRPGHLVPGHATRSCSR